MPTQYSERQNAPETAQDAPSLRARSRWARFHLRELFLLILIFALAAGWYSNSLNRNAGTGASADAVKHIEGPLLVDYRVQWDENTVVTHDDVPAASVDFHEGYVVLNTTGGRGRIIPVASLQSFQWKPAPGDGLHSTPNTTTERR